MKLYILECYSSREDDGPTTSYLATATDQNELVELVTSNTVFEPYERIDVDPLNGLTASIPGPARIMGQLGEGRFNIK